MSNAIPSNTIQRNEFNPLSSASSPGGLTLSNQKLRLLRPDLYGIGGSFRRFFGRLGLGFCQRSFIAQQLQLGDSRAAMVISTKPLLISAYTDELDCVAILELPDVITPIYELKVGTRLLTVNFYGSDNQIQPDLIPGQGNTRRWEMFMPLVADFVSGDYERIRLHKQRISEAEWQMAYYLGLQYRQQRPGWVRFGLPMLSAIAAERPKRHEVHKSVYERQ